MLVLCDVYVNRSTPKYTAPWSVSSLWSKTNAHGSVMLCEQTSRTIIWSAKHTELTKIYRSLVIGCVLWSKKCSRNIDFGSKSRGGSVKVQSKVHFGKFVEGFKQKQRAMSHRMWRRVPNVTVMSHLVWCHIGCYIGGSGYCPRGPGRGHVVRWRNQLRSNRSPARWPQTSAYHRRTSTPKGGRSKGGQVTGGS